MHGKTETAELSPPLVSIVCVTHDRRDLVLRCLESCAAQDYPRIEIVVVANGCDDGTAEAVGKKYAGARIISTPENIGFFPALNLAIRDARGEYVMTIDDDACFVGTDAIARFVEAFAGEPELGAATCNIEGPAEEPPVRVDRYVHSFKTGFTMMPRKVFTEWVGYYPELFFRSGGEYYLCAALWEGGWRVKQLSGVRMRHERAMRGRSDWDWKYYGLRSQILVMFMRDPWYLVAPRFCSKWARSMVKFARAGHFGTWCVAWLSALHHVPDALRMRRPMSWRTQKLLWRLRREIVTDPGLLPTRQAGRREKAA